MQSKKILMWKRKLLLVNHNQAIFPLWYQSANNVISERESQEKYTILQKKCIIIEIYHNKNISQYKCIKYKFILSYSIHTVY